MTQMQKKCAPPQKKIQRKIRRHSTLCHQNFSMSSCFVPFPSNIWASSLNKINHRWQEVGSHMTSKTCSTIFPNSPSRNFQSVLTLCGFHDFTVTCPNKDAGCTRLRMNLQINLTLAASCCKQMPVFRKLLWVHPRLQFCQKLIGI